MRDSNILIDSKNNSGLSFLNYDEKRDNNPYFNALVRALNEMISFFHRNIDSYTSESLKAYYRERHLDPDNYAIRFSSDIKCTCDGLISLNRICLFEKDFNDIIKTYVLYRRYPIFFFPSENGGINTSRSSIFGDRIDHTLYDLKIYYSDGPTKCKLKNAFGKSKTNKWLNGFNGFEELIEWLNIKGIFTDESNNVFDLSSNNNAIIDSYLSKEEYRKPWAETYYNNLKNMILKCYERLL